MAAIPGQKTELELRIRLSRDASDELAHRAAETGQDLGSVASDLLEQAIASRSGNGGSDSIPNRVAMWDAWVAKMREWGARICHPAIRWMTVAKASMKVAAYERSGGHERSDPNC